MPQVQLSELRIEILDTYGFWWDGVLTFHATAVVAGSFHRFSVFSSVLLAIHIAEGELDGQSDGASATPAFVELGVVRSIGSALESAGIEKVAAVERN